MASNRRAARRTAVESSRRLSPRRWLWLNVTAASFVVAAFGSFPNTGFADENGVSFWIPGFFGSLAATPQQPGWSFAALDYYTNVSASGNAALSREISIGQFNPTINASINANVSARADIGMFALDRKSVV